jgi:hypothetical protein
MKIAVPIRPKKFSHNLWGSYSIGSGLTTGEKMSYLTVDSKNKCELTE